MKRLGAVALLLMCGCYPFEPGSDLTDVGSSDLIAAPPEDMPAIPEDATVETGADVTGTFDVTASLRADIGPPSPATYLFVAAQEGMIEGGQATLSIEVRDPMDPDAAGPKNMPPAAITSEGAFQTTVEDLVIKKEFNPDIFAEDANAVMEIDAMVLNSDCFAGTMKVTLLGARLVFNPMMPMDVELNGTFSAGRQGTSGCAMEDEPDMGQDMGDMG